MKTIVFNKENNDGIVYALVCKFEEYKDEDDNLSNDSVVEFSITNEEIDQFIIELTEFKEV